MTRYRKKPVEVEAWQVGTEPVPEWVADCSIPYEFASSMYCDVRVAGIDGDFPCIEGWYLVRLDDTKFEADEPAEFFRYYEVVE